MSGRFSDRFVTRRINNNNNLGNAITVTANAFGGYDVIIGTAVSRVYIKCDLYYNNDLMLKETFQMAIR